MSAAELWGCVVLPQMAAQAGMRLRPGLAGSAVVVMEGERPLERVCSVNAKASQVGLAEGMTRVEVETFDGVTVLTRSLAEESAAKGILLEVMSRFTPRAEPRVSGPDWECCIDLAGTERLLGDERTLAGKIVEALERVGFVACVVMARNGDAGFSVCRGLARGVRFVVPTHHERQRRDECGTREGVRGERNAHARQRMQVRVVAAGDEAKVLAPLSLAVLKLEEEARERFGIWGISTLGELAALPETALITRMGQIGKRLRLRARGELPHLLEPAAEVFSLEEVLELDEPVETLEPLLFLLNPMLEQLIVRAQERALALAAVTVELGVEEPADRIVGEEHDAELMCQKGDMVHPVFLTQTTNDAFLMVQHKDRVQSVQAGSRKRDMGCPVHVRTVRPAVAVLDRALLLKMLQLDLEAHPSPGAVIRVRLSGEAGDTSRIQLGLFAPQMPEPTRFEDTHARLVSLVGESNVGRVKPLDTHAPEGFVLERFRLPEGGYKAPPARDDGAQPATALRRMRPPVEVHVRMRGRQIAEFWFEARRYEVLRCYGPWRASGDWWCGSVWSADTWDVAAVNEGEVLVCLVGHDLRAGVWRMEGVYD